MAQVGDVGVEVDEAALDCFKVGSADLGERHAAVPLEGAGGGHEHDCGGLEAGSAALDVEELFGAEVRAEARFRNGVVGKLQRSARRGDGVAAVSDVGEGAAVNEGDVPLNRLNEVGLEGFEKEREECARGAEFGAGKGRAVGAQAENDAVDARAQIFHVVGKAKNGHEFGSGRDVEARFSRDAVGRAPEARDDVAQHALVHIHHAAPEDFLENNLALMARIVEKRGEEVVGGGDGVQVARKVEADRLHREHLAVAAARGAALHAEDGAERGFAKGERGASADALQALSERDRGGGLARARRHSGSGRHQNELSFFLAGRIKLNLGFVAAVGFEFGVGEARGMRKLIDRNEFVFLCDFDVGLHEDS